jgi:hypothetical protein
MAVERFSDGFGTPALQRKSGSRQERGPTDREVLTFLRELRLDRLRCYSLNSGRRLLREVAASGLVGSEVKPFINQMLELRSSGLADWTPASDDVWGDDLLHAAEFHLTAQGQSRLRELGGAAQFGADPAS